MASHSNSSGDVDSLRWVLALGGDVLMKFFVQHMHMAIDEERMRDCPEGGGAGGGGGGRGAGEEEIWE